MKKIQSNRFISLACAFAFAAIFSSCSGDGVPTLGVSIMPKCVELLPGQTFQFNATIFIDEVAQAPDPNNGAVIWSVSGGGAISNAAGSEGLYQAPDTTPPPSPTVTVTAISQEDSQKQGQATVFLTGSCPEVPPVSQQF